MTILDTIEERVKALRAWDELDVEAAVLPSCAVRLSDESVADALAEVTALINHGNRLQAVLAGVAAQRSRREPGSGGGLAGVHGHPNPASWIQSLTGGTKADADRQVRVGMSLLDGVGVDEPAESAGDGVPPLPVRPVWDEPLRQAVLEGVLTPAQQDAIRKGLGEPAVALADPSVDSTVDPVAVEEAWRLAAEGLIVEAATLPVEELGKRARIIRDLLDPTGAEDLFAKRYAARSYREWTDHEGQHHARIVYDDEMSLFVRSVFAAALRPRRGGPRFVASDEQAAAVALRDDPRTNEQLAYDLLTGLFRAGALANAKDVFGARQPGVRLVTVNDITGPRDAFGRLLGAGHAEDGGDTLPGSVLDRAVCTTGTVTVAMDSSGNPLNLGRTHRTFTATQTLALAARDGGCRWTGCSRPASYCEAHHINPYSQGGRTDIDQGILLCRHHHMTLHNQGWRITRDERGLFLLHPPDGPQPTVLESKAAWKWAWDPPPPPDRAPWRATPSAA